MTKGTRVLGYLRVSTGEQAASGLGLAAQRDAIEREAERRGWELVAIHEDAGVSGKAITNRPGLTAALDALDRGDAGALVVAKLDRLSRSLVDAAGLIERAKRRGWSLVALDLGLDMSTASGEMVAGIMAVVAQWERNAISARTRDALAVKRAQGVRLGRPVTLPDDVTARIVREREAGRSLPAIARALNDDAVPTAHGGARWHPSTVRAVLRRAGALAA